jgi:hypothetical protein
MMRFWGCRPDCRRYAPGPAEGDARRASRQGANEAKAAAENEKWKLADDLERATVCHLP